MENDDATQKRKEFVLFRGGAIQMSSSWNELYMVSYYSFSLDFY